MPGIETLQEPKNTCPPTVTFRWQDMNISLAMTVGLDGKRFLSAKPEGAVLAADITESGMARWIISKAEEEHKDAGAPITCSGFAPPVTGPSITGSQD